MRRSDARDDRNCSTDPETERQRRETRRIGVATKCDVLSIERSACIGLGLEKRVLLEHRNTWVVCVEGGAEAALQG